MYIVNITRTLNHIDCQRQEKFNKYPQSLKLYHFLMNILFFSVIMTVTTRVRRLFKENVYYIGGVFFGAPA